MLCSLLVAFASLFALACGSKSAHTMANVKANAVAAVTDQIHALAEAGFAARKNNLRRTYDETEFSRGGFIYFDFSAEAGCKNPLATAGLAANKCVVGTNYAYKLMIAANSDSCKGGIVEYFGDKECTESLGTNDLMDADFSCKEVNLGIFGQGSKTFGKLMCTKFATPKLVRKSGVTEFFVNSTDCALGTLDLYVAMSVDTCIADQLKVTCTADNEMTWNYYEAGNGCSGDNFEMEPYAKECVDTGLQNVYDDDDDDDDGDNNIAVFPEPPSASTTPFPTMENAVQATSENYYCAQATKLVKFTASQVVNGFSLAAYTENAELYDRTFRRTIASTMKGVAPEDIKNLKVTENTAAAREAPASLLRTLVSRLLAEASVVITYTVEVATTVPAEEIMKQLTDSVEDGTFTALLQQYAEESGATALTTASSDSVTSTETSDDDETAVLDTGAIIGIAVGGFVALVLIVGAVVMLCLRGKTSSVGVA